MRRTDAIGAQHDVVAPRAQRQRQARRRAAAAVGGEPAIAALPAVAVRAMKDRPAVALLEADDARQIVDDARRDQQKSRLLLAAVRHRYAVMIVFELGASDADAPEFDA